MPDIIKTEANLHIECLFMDGDTRTITLRDPKDELSSSDIKNLQTFMVDNQIILGDQNGSAFWKIRKAIRRNTTTKYLDLSN